VPDSAGGQSAAQERSPAVPMTVTRGPEGLRRWRKFQGVGGRGLNSVHRIWMQQLLSPGDSRQDPAPGGQHTRSFDANLQGSNSSQGSQRLVRELNAAVGKAIDPGHLIGS